MTAESGVRVDGGAANFYLEDVNLLRLLDHVDPALRARWDTVLSDFGTWVVAEVDPASDHTHRRAPPVLESHDRNGRLTNRVRHNPAWRRVSGEVYRRGAIRATLNGDLAVTSEGPLMSAEEYAAANGGEL